MKNLYKLVLILCLPLLMMGIGCNSESNAAYSDITKPIDNPVIVKKDGYSMAPAFEGKSLDGEIINLKDYVGEKAVIVDFWASWCSNCQRSMPKTNKFYEKYQDEIQVIGVNMAESEEQAQKFYDRYDIDFPSILDPNGELQKLYGVIYTNWHVLIDKEGRWIRNVPGDLSEEDILGLIQS